MNIQGECPLKWPAGWKRTQTTSRSPFSHRIGTAVTMANVRFKMARELRLLGAEDGVMTSNIVLNASGQPRGGLRAPPDTGASVWFTLGKDYRVLACDRWDRVEHNFHAIARHIEAMRAQERWGVGTLEQAFAGYMGLPQTAGQEPWWIILGFGEEPDASIGTARTVEIQFRAMVRKAHPDNGGSVDAFQRLQGARTAATDWLAKQGVTV